MLLYISLIAGVVPVQQGPKWDMTSSTADTDTKLYAVWERVDGEQFSYDDIAATQDDSSALTSADAKKTIKITFNFWVSFRILYIT